MNMNLGAGSSAVESQARNASRMEQGRIPVNPHAVHRKLMSTLEPAVRLLQVEQGVDNSRVGGSNPSQRATLPGHSKRPVRPVQFRWREPLGKKECPYAHRTMLNLGLFSVRIHEWHRSDDKRFFHDHPWHFVTLVLRGSYVDVTATNRDTLTAGSIRFRSANHAHYVEVQETGALTILLTSAKVRDWGFWVKGKFKRPLRYFGKYGHPPCSEQ